MAEEDLIFGKNRHMFGGIEPSNMRTFNAKIYGSKIRLVCELPYDTTVNDQTLCSVAGAVIRRKTDGYPVDEFDGDFVADIKTDTTIIDQDIASGNIYYYAAFPYSGQGVYNRSSKNRTIFDFGSNHYLFGYDLVLDDSNPDTRVSYPTDVMNYGYEPARMDFSTDTFNYGDWPSTHGNNFMPRPCILSYAGTVTQYLDPNDYSKQYNSTSSSSVATPGSGGNAMMEWPKIYMHREVVNGVYKFRCSDLQVEEDWDCWCNYDANDNVIDHFYTGIYPGVKDINSSYSDKLRSISGYSITTGSVNTDGMYYYSFFNYYARKNNPTYSTSTYLDGWNTELLSDRLLIQDLLVMMAKTTNCQLAYGMGASRGGITSNGTLNAKGLFWGSNSTDSAVKVFGMENWWGNYARLVNGYAIDGVNANGVYIKMTIGTHDGTTCTGFDESSDDYYKYLNVGSFPYSAGAEVGFIKSLKFTEPYGRIYPNSHDGSSTTYEADYSGVYASYALNTVYMGTYPANTGLEEYNGPFTQMSDQVKSRPGNTNVNCINQRYTCSSISCKPLLS